jgi:hypothetical protein
VLLAALALGWTLAGAPADERSIDRFLADLRDASDRNDRAAIARMVHYPLEVRASGWIIPVDDLSSRRCRGRGRDRRGTRAWTGRVLATGEHVIDVVRAVPTGDPVLT